MSDDREGFLARWSRRKAGVASPADEQRDGASQGAPDAPASTAPPAPATAIAPHEIARGEPANAVEAAAARGAEPPAPPLPTLVDVARLTPDSDYTRFMAPGVDSAVRNAAMKKLFSDPQFNVMDGLDVYIDDYGKPDPLPLSMLRKLRQSELLGLFDDDPAAAPPAGAGSSTSPDNANLAAARSEPSGVPSSPPSDLSARAEDDPHLRLQPDDDDRRSGAGEGPRA